MNIITQNNHQDIVISKNISDFAKKYQIAQILRTSNAYKHKGFSVISIFLEVFATIFLHQTMYLRMKLHSEAVAFKKQTFYRFLNSCHINWRKFTSLLCLRIISDTISPLTCKDRINAFIIDDSLYSRGRSKKVELLAKVYDHVNHCYEKGFRLLTLCWTDGNTTLPVSHCLLSSPNQKNRINEEIKTDSRSNGANQRKLAQTEAPQVVLQLLKEAKTLGFAVKHVLFDTWFCSPKSLIDICHLGFHTIAMVKKNKTRYLFNGKPMTVKEIFDASKKRRGRSKYLLATQVTVEKNDEAIPAKMVFVRNRNKRNEFLVPISTDIEIEPEEIVRIYGKRWGIEVFFKMCKSYLNLTKECRSISYDGITAHISIVMTRYMMIAIEQRMNTDERSFGELFALTAEEMPDIRFIDAFLMLQSKMESILEEYGIVEEKLISQMLDAFIMSISQIFKVSLKIY